MMKKAIIAAGVIALLLAGCTGKAAKEAEKARALEIEQLETVSTQIDSTLNEIDEAVMKLDTLINEL
jgi:PBP1b-binding outer membrane lipoprotein LpoB